MKIMLCCTAGMSTNLLVSKMTASARQRSIAAEIVAVPESDIINRLKAQDCDVILLGPQIRSRFKQVKQEAEPYKIPVGIIDTVRYAKMDGRYVLDQAIELYNEVHQ